jgi:hypothetical protein
VPVEAHTVHDAQRLLGERSDLSRNQPAVIP